MAGVVAGAAEVGGVNERAVGCELRHESFEALPVVSGLQRIFERESAAIVVAGHVCIPCGVNRDRIRGVAFGSAEISRVRESSPVGIDLHDPGVLVSSVDGLRRACSSWEVTRLTLPRGVRFAQSINSDTRAALELVAAGIGGIDER